MAELQAETLSAGQMQQSIFNTTVSLITDGVQRHMDQTVQSRGYDDIGSACTYVGDEDPTFNAEGIACRTWRSRVWRYCYQMQSEIVQGLRSVPTLEDLILELPVLEW